MWSFKHGMLETLGFNPVPQAAVPILELWGNKSFHFDTPIESMSDQRKLPQDRYNAYTSDSMVAIGQALGLSPKQLEHIWKGYTGTMGAYALSAADLLVAWAQDKPTEGEMLPTRIPVLKSFYRGAGPAHSTQYSTDLYGRLKEVNQIAASLKALRGEERQAFVNENRDKLKHRKFLNRQSKALRELRKRRDRIVADPRMSAKEKQFKLDQLQRRMNQVAARASQRTEAAF